jgi:hypothetical protein
MASARGSRDSLAAFCLRDRIYLVCKRYNSAIEYLHKIWTAGAVCAAIRCSVREAYRNLIHTIAIVVALAKDLNYVRPVWLIRDDSCFSGVTRVNTNVRKKSLTSLSTLAR